MTREHQFIEAALQQVGAPYVWGGKGTHLFDPVKGLVVSPFIGSDYGRPPLLTFDCSGLMSWALWSVGGKDQRGALSAQVLKDTSPAVQAIPSVGPHLRYYGSGPDHIFHVACGIAYVDGMWLVVEASGGDHTTTTPLMAQQRDAKVRCGFERRADFVCGSRIPV